MKTAIALMLALAATGAYAKPHHPMTDAEEQAETVAVARNGAHRLYEGLLTQCFMLQDVKARDFNRVAEQRHLTVTMADCVKASAELVKDAEGNVSFSPEFLQAAGKILGVWQPPLSIVDEMKFLDAAMRETAATPK